MKKIATVVFIAAFVVVVALLMFNAVLIMREYPDY